MALDPVTAGLEIGEKLIDRLWPDPAQAARAKGELESLRVSGELATMAALGAVDADQAATNTAEAGNSSIFVSGWRPFIGWLCGVALGFQFIVGPVLTWGATLAGVVMTFPCLDTTPLLSLLGGMLGMSTLRMVEKIRGVASK